MFAMFTDRARMVVKLAEQEAQRNNCEYVGTEHLLLGLVKEGSGVAHHILESLEVSIGKIRSQTEKITQPPDQTVEVDKPTFSLKLRQLFEYAGDEAKQLDHRYIGTEHLLLGLLRDDKSTACMVLINLGVSTQDVRTAVLELLGHFDEAYEFEKVYSNEGEVFNVVRLNNLYFKEHVAVFYSKSNKISFSKALSLNEVSRVVKACWDQK